VLLAYRAAAAQKKIPEKNLFLMARANSICQPGSTSSFQNGAWHIETWGDSGHLDADLTTVTEGATQ